MAKRNKITDSEKIEKGKLLDSAEIEKRAFNKYGPKYRKKLAEKIGGSSALYTYVFLHNNAPKKLYEINEHLKTVKDVGRKSKIIN